MTSLTIALDEPLTAPLAEEYGRRIYFAAGEVLDFAFVRRDGQVTARSVQLGPTGWPTHSGDHWRLIPKDALLRRPGPRASRGTPDWAEVIGPPPRVVWDPVV